MPWLVGLKPSCYWLESNKKWIHPTPWDTHSSLSRLPTQPIKPYSRLITCLLEEFPGKVRNMHLKCIVWVFISSVNVGLLPNNPSFLFPFSYFNMLLSVELSLGRWDDLKNSPALFTAAKPAVGENTCLGRESNFRQHLHARFRLWFYLFFSPRNTDLQKYGFIR